MQCPKCGDENQDDAGVCSSCGSGLEIAAGTSERVTPRPSGLAIAAFVLGVVSPLTLGLTALPGVVLGIVAIVVIEMSGGRVTGRAYAVIGIVVSVLIFFMLPWPMLLKERRMAFRMVCGANLSGIGRAMLLYSDDYEGKFPRSAGPDGQWAMRTQNWKAPNRFIAYGLTAEGTGGVGTISSCFYLLVKYDYLTPESLICPGDSGSTVFIAADAGAGDRDLSDLWDFGGSEPGKHCSYTYHMPFGPYALTTSAEPGMAVAADRNPFMKSPRKKPKKISLFNPQGGRKAVEAGNAWQHENDGQNVLFMDMHVGFEKGSYCGINDDNIYTFWDGGDIRRGAQPVLGSASQDESDSLLVNDGS